MAVESISGVGNTAGANGIAMETPSQKQSVQKAASNDSSEIKEKLAEEAREAKEIKKEKKDENRIEDELITPNSEMTAEFLRSTVDRVNRQLRGSAREFNFSVHEKTGQYVIKVLDRETKEVIREIPPEKTLDAVAKMWELTGLFVDKKK